MIGAPTIPRALLVICVLMQVPHPTSGQSRDADVQWNRIIGARPTQLSSRERDRVESLFRRERSYGSCTDTIARCLSIPQPSRSARRLAGFVIRRVQGGWTDGQITKGIQLRQTSIFPDPSDLATIDLSSAQCRGSSKAAVTVVEYADFQCPSCRQVSKILHGLVDAHRGQVRLCFKHFPIRSHDRALPAAVAALAAARQGRFWPMHRALFSSTPRLDDRALDRCARRAKVPNMERWRRDRREPDLTQQVASDKQEGIENGVNATPGLFFNRKRYRVQLFSKAALSDRLEEELDLTSNRP